MERIAIILLLSAALAACGSTPAPRSPSPSVAARPQPLPPRCDAAAAAGVVGQIADAALLEKARAAAGADMVRALRPDQGVTQDYRAGRLNLHLDGQRRIVRASCG